MDEKLIQDVQFLLDTKTIREHYYDYMAIHERIYGCQWHGCKCKKAVLYGIIKTWYNENKNNDNGEG